MGKAKLAAYIVFIIMVAVTIIVASSSSSSTISDTEQLIDTGEQVKTTPNELEDITKSSAPVTVGVFLRDGNDLAERGIEAFKNRNTDVQVVVRESSDAKEQYDNIASFVEKNGDKGAFFVDPVSTTYIKMIAETAEDHGTYWAAVGDTISDFYPMDYVHYVSYEGSDESEAGYASAKAMMDALDGNSTNEIFVLKSDSADKKFADRQSGLYRAMADRLDIVAAEINKAANREAAKKLVAEWLTKHTAVRAIWADDDELALGAAEAVKNAGRLGILVCGSHMTMESAEAVKDGTMWCSSYMSDAEKLLYGMLLSYKAADGTRDIMSMSTEDRYFKVEPLAAKAADVGDILNGSLEYLFSGKPNNTTALTVKM